MCRPKKESIDWGWTCLPTLVWHFRGNWLFKMVFVAFSVSFLDIQKTSWLSFTAQQIHIFKDSGNISVGRKFGVIYFKGILKVKISLHTLTLQKWVWSPEIMKLHIERRFNLWWTDWCNTNNLERLWNGGITPPLCWRNRIRGFSFFIQLKKIVVFPATIWSWFVEQQ